MFEGLQRGRADVMLDPLRIAFRSLFVDSQAEEKRDDDPVPPAAGLGQPPTGIREEYGAVRFPPHQASSFESRDVLGHGRRLDRRFPPALPLRATRSVRRSVQRNLPPFRSHVPDARSRIPQPVLREPCRQFRTVHVPVIAALSYLGLCRETAGLTTCLHRVDKLAVANFEVGRPR